MCFDATTHLISYQEGKQPSPQGEVPYAVKFSDWREVQGVKRPHREEMTVGPHVHGGPAGAGPVRREDRPEPLQACPKAGAKPACDKQRRPAKP